MRLAALREPGHDGPEVGARREGGDMQRQLGAGVQPRIRHGIAEDLADRHDAGPHRQVVVGLVVLGRPGADLGRRLLDGHAEQGRRLQLLRIDRPQLAIAVRQEALDVGIERRPLLVVVLDLVAPCRRPSPSDS